MWRRVPARSKGRTILEHALAMEDERKRGVHGRIFVAGGGSVREEHTLRQLAGDQTPLSDGQLTHVFMDPWAVTTDGFRDLKCKVEKKSLHSLGVLVL